MKKIITAVLCLLFVVAIAGCRDRDSTAQRDSTESGSIATDTSDSIVDTAEVDQEELANSNADDPVFVQTGTADESIIITPVSKAPMVVVDLGELTTLEIYSEYIQDVHLWNEDLYVDRSLSRGDTVMLTIEANEEGFFDIVDKNQNNTEVIRFVVAGTSLG